MEKRAFKLEAEKRSKKPSSISASQKKEKRTKQVKEEPKKDTPVEKKASTASEKPKRLTKKRLAAMTPEQAAEVTAAAVEARRQARLEKRIQRIKTITEESRNAINAAREAFDRLAPELQGAVSNKDTLSKAEETFEQLAIQTVTDAINQIGAVSLDNEDAIIAAEKAYNKFDESIQQKIENRDVLFAAEETLTQLKIEKAQSAIEEIGNVTLGSKAVIDAANAAFNSIPTASRIKVENREKLTKAKETYDALVNEQKRQAEIEDARKLIRVTKVAVSAPDSAGGVELYFNYINNSDKVIKYVNFSVTFYNAVGDVVKGKYDQSTVNRCYDTGPFKKGEGRTGTWWHWGDFYNWDITSVKLVDLSIEYTDGTTVTFTKDQVDGVQY